jgi:hypothetical protein
MSLDRLLALVSEPALIDVARHWDAARAGRPMPGWSRIEPRAIARHLPIVWSWRHDPESGALIGRLAGEEIVAALGESLRGKRDEAFWEGRGGDAIVARHRRAVSEPCLVHGRGPVFAHAGRHGVGERIILPLAEDGERADGILGATVYRFVETPRPDGPFIASDETEQVTFLPLA